jgi:hypothetical protein
MLNHTQWAFGGAYQLLKLFQFYLSPANADVDFAQMTVRDPGFWDASVAGLPNADGPSLPEVLNYTAWAIAPSAFPVLSTAGVLQPLDELIQRNSDLSAVWLDLPKVFQEVAGVYDGSIVGLPYSAETPLLYWRKDLLEQLGLSPPATWEEALTLARRINGSKVRAPGGYACAAKHDEVDVRRLCSVMLPVTC